VKDLNDTVTDLHLEFLISNNFTHKTMHQCLYRHKHQHHCGIKRNLLLLLMKECSNMSANTLVHYKSLKGIL